MGNVSNMKNPCLKRLTYAITITEFVVYHQAKSHTYVIALVIVYYSSKFLRTALEKNVFCFRGFRVACMLVLLYT